MTIPTQNIMTIQNMTVPIQKIVKIPIQNIVTIQNMTYKTR